MQLFLGSRGREKYSTLYSKSSLGLSSISPSPDKCRSAAVKTFVILDKVNWSKPS